MINYEFDYIQNVNCLFLQIHFSLYDAIIITNYYKHEFLLSENDSINIIIIYFSHDAINIITYSD